jgi:hypothetical protein
MQTTDGENERMPLALGREHAVFERMENADVQVQKWRSVQGEKR